MKWLVIFLSLFLLNCTTLPEDIKTSNIIRVVELESVEIEYRYQLTPQHVLCFAKVRGTFVAAIVIIDNMWILRYCYLDQGKLTAFCLDKELFATTSKVSYIVDTSISSDEVEYITNALIRANKGLDPIYEEEVNIPLQEV